ncbi:hypothetical protein [Flavobacterium sp.]|uniref:hypothetical protein n=1 Tax=Flavobacterium sp. TaxID=239 RepID=UPI00261924E0|nr:hypothetical protein [Flavobacterium sp.]
MKKYLYLILLLIGTTVAPAQVQQEKDTAALYRKIEKISHKSKFTKWLHKAIFEPVEKQKARQNIRKKAFRNLKRYQGKIVRNISVTTLDPFGFSETDINKKPKNSGEKFGNAVHLKSKDFAIRNLLLVRRNKPLDTIRLKESERIIRAQRYISRVRITPIVIPNSKDSIDLDVRVVDSWSFIPQFSGSTSRSSIDIQERNFLGFGHNWRNRFVNRFSDGENAYFTTYSVPNIKNSFVQTTISYQNDLNNFYGKSINIERPFYSPLTKWAGGVYIDAQFRQDSIPDVTNDYELQNFKYHSEDFWLGHAFKIFEDDTEEEITTNLVVSGRYLNIGFNESPPTEFDPADFFSDERQYLVGIGITSRQFVEDKFLFNYGIVEDVAIGKIYGLTFGQQQKNDRMRAYAGFRLAHGDYYRIGFLCANFEGGSFFRRGSMEQSALTLTVNYFTPLISLGDWSLRQFFKPQFILGFNRVDSYGDRLTLNENSLFLGNYGAGVVSPNPSGIAGFNAPLVGTSKFIVSFQTQSYSPWQLIGFRLNPFFSYSGGLLGNGISNMINSKLYSKIGAGIIISNDYLVFSSFQISFAYYSNLPNGAANPFQTNSFETTDLRLENFDFGKPRTIIYK